MMDRRVGRRRDCLRGQTIAKRRGQVDATRRHVRPSARPAHYAGGAINKDIIFARRRRALHPSVGGFDADPTRPDQTRRDLSNAPHEYLPDAVAYPKGGGAAPPRTRGTNFLDVFKTRENLFLCVITLLYRHLLAILCNTYACR